MPIKKKKVVEEPMPPTVEMTSPKEVREYVDARIGEVSTRDSGPITSGPISPISPTIPVPFADTLVSKNTVYIEKSITKNLGDYNSAKISVGITLNVNPTDEDVAAAQAAIKIASELVDIEIDNQLKDLDK